MIGARWLARNNALPWDLHGAHLDPVHQTRREEFSFVCDTLAVRPRSLVVDAGSGFAMGAHMLPYMLGNLGFNVLALDADARSLQMEPHPRVARALADIARPSFLADASIAYWVCVSVLEHLDGPVQADTIREAFRLLKPGGLAILTVDHSQPRVLTESCESAGFLVGPADDTQHGEPTDPPVSAIVAVKPAL